MRPIESIVTSDAFNRVPEAVGFQQAGSFVSYLIETEGFEPVRRVFREGSRDDGLERVRATFAASYGFALSEAEGRWLAFLDSGA